MLRATLIFFLSSMLAIPQIQLPLTCVASSLATPTITNHTYYPSGVACPNLTSITDSATCDLTTSFVVGATGDTGVLFLGYCGGASCQISGSDISVTGCGGTWTQPSNTAVNVASAFNLRAFVAPNLTASAGCTLTLHGSGFGVNGAYYVRAESLDVNGASVTAPVDTSVSNEGNGSGTTATITSAGNVSGTNELVLAKFTATATITNGGACSTVDLGESAELTLSDSNPASGASVTCAVTQGSGNFFGILLGLKP